MSCVIQESHNKLIPAPCPSLERVRSELKPKGKNWWHLKLPNTQHSLSGVSMPSLGFNEPAAKKLLICEKHPQKECMGMLPT